MFDTNVKILEMPCIISTEPEPCPYKAFVQVVIIGDPELQKKVDARATEKMSRQLSLDHSKGLHDGR